MSPLLTKYF